MPGIAISGGDGDGTAQVTILSASTDQPVVVVTPFPGFSGDIRVAQGDVNGEGISDLIVAQGPWGLPEVKVLDGRTGLAKLDFFAFAPHL